MGNAAAEYYRRTDSSLTKKRIRARSIVTPVQCTPPGLTPRFAPRAFQSKEAGPRPPIKPDDDEQAASRTRHNSAPFSLCRTTCGSGRQTRQTDSQAVGDRIAWRRGRQRRGSRGSWRRTRGCPRAGRLPWWCWTAGARRRPTPSIASTSPTRPRSTPSSRYVTSTASAAGAEGVCPAAGVR